jgi:hypothetical protein
MPSIRLTPLGRVLFCCLLTPHVSSLLGGQPSPLDENKLLAAIAAVETGTTNLARPSRKVGRAGERSAWQFTAATWRRYTRTPFAAASSDAILAHLVAQLHLRYLRLELESRGHLTSPYNIALAWNAGPRCVFTDTASIPSRDYARRVDNLYRFGQ